MNKKIDEYLKKESAIKEFENSVIKAIDDFFAGLSTEEKNHILGKDKNNSKPQLQISSQAYEFHKNKEYEKALPLFIELAEHGDPFACKMVGDYFYYGYASDVSLEEAYRYYSLGQKYGSNECRFKVGYMLFYGEGTSQDIIKGLDTLEDAAFFGSSDAVKCLVEIYENGIFVDADYEVSDYWRGKIEEIGEA